MMAAGRNLFVTLTAFTGALFLCALGQEIMNPLLQNFSDRVVANMDIATLGLLVLLGSVFLLFGYVVAGLLRGRWVLAWLLSPLVCLYAAAILEQPYVYQCNSFSDGGCWLPHAFFVVAGAAVLVGYLGFLRAQRSNRGAV
jgi:hypothetical protein